MLLIRDHNRMKLEAVTPCDSTHDQQFRLLPISHPEVWLASSEEFRSGDPDWNGGSGTPGVSGNKA